MMASDEDDLNQSERDPSLRPLWLMTQLLVCTSGRTVDLGTIPADRLADAIAPLKLPIFIITAHNPDAERLPDEENRSRNLKLRGLLEERRLAWLEAVGRAPDGSWAESSFAISGLAEADAIEIGGQFGQLAIFMVTLDHVVVIPIDGSFRDTRPRFTGGEQAPEWNNFIPGRR
jgi:uncharacterized protein DUF3293